MSARRASRSRVRDAAWLFGVLALAAVVSVVVAYGEIREVLRALRHVRIAWLLLALGLQALTYVIAATVWQLALARQGDRRSLATLVPLALAMLFSNQAVPSVGVSGGLVVEEALSRRGTPRPIAMAALLMGLLTTYSAFVLALAATLTWLSIRGTTSRVAIAVAIVFTFLAATVSVGILEAHRLTVVWRKRLQAWPLIGPALVATATAPAAVMRSPGLFAALTGLQLVEILIDAATMGVSLRAIGITIAPGAVFSSYVMAAAGSRVAFAPLGLGTFEGASVFMLHASGVSIEPALAATLVFRGLTLWLPMIPGLWCARRALR